LPHGSYVNAGDVVARFDPRRIDEEIDGLEREIVSAEAAQAVSVERAAQEEQGAREKLEDARYALDRAREELEGWTRHELDFRRRSEELQAQFTQNNIDDAQHELQQLEAMYADDELVEATEEIVLARSRRDLARSLVSQKLSQERVEYDRSQTLPVQEHAKRQAVTRAEGALARLERMQELEARTRATGLEQGRHAFEEKREKLEGLRADRAAMDVRAPRAGVFLHGGRRDQEPGHARPVHEALGRAAARTTLFTICAPDSLEIVLTVPESRIVEAHGGVAALVTPVSAPDQQLAGRLDLDRTPTPQGGGSEAQFQGRVALDRVPVGMVPGMRAHVRLVAEKLPGAVLVPSNAVFGTGPDAHVWIAGQESEHVLHAIVTGPVIGSEVVVRSGLAAGERVLLAEPAR
jgi:multidrug resistance efflux pump